MRPGQNKRMRGRNNNNNNRKGPNPLTRSYESNGPDVKIRGTAHHIGEKYLQLARDAQSSGDPVMAESYLQHAEHYFRLIAAAQQAQQQAAYGYQRPPGEQAEQDEDGDDDFESLPDRFASPAERAPQPPAPQPYADRQPYSNGAPPYEARQDRYDRQNQPQPQPNFDRPPSDRQTSDRQTSDRQTGDRQNGGQSGDRQNYDRQDRPYDNRNARNDRGYQDRSNGQDRGNQNRGNQDRGGQDRNNQDRGGQDRPRDYDNRGFRNDRGPRDYRDNGQPREQRQPVVDEPATGLPAFITAPTRVQPESVASEPPVETTEAAAPENGDEAAFHLRPRRRRRPKGEFVGEGEGQQEAPATDPVGD